LKLREARSQEGEKFLELRAGWDDYIIKDALHSRSLDNRTAPKITAR
jgi:hypothetical protein